MAGTMAESMFVPGSIYSKCGVMLEGLHPASEAQIDLFAAVDPKGRAAASGDRIAIPIYTWSS
jgi:hypothetical protein